MSTSTPQNGVSQISRDPNNNPIDHPRNGNANANTLGLGGTGRRDPRETNAYLVGGGIASLAAAVHLIQDAKVPAGQIHIFESLPVLGGAMDGTGDPSEGYILRGGRMLNFSYVCLYDLLNHIPSLGHSEITVAEEIKEFNIPKSHKTHANARVIATTKSGPEVIDLSRMGLDWEDRKAMVKLTVESEKTLGTKSIQDLFPQPFFKTNFWYMWATMFAFQPWHSAVEFRRYLHRFLHEFPRISTLEGVERTPYNQYDSIIRPIIKWLKDAGVDFRGNTKVNDLKMIKGIPCTVDEIHMIQDGTPIIVNVDPDDIVFVTIGSMTGDASIGTNTEAPIPVTDGAKRDGSWELWAKLAAKDERIFGNPQNFLSRIPQSQWESFTVTLRDPQFFDRIIGFTKNEPGTGALMTFKDSNWLMSIVVPRQPHFIGQPEGIQVFWGYGLFPSQIGNFVKKPMTECSGHEIFDELLGHLNFPREQILKDSITRPCIMPYITSQFLTRKYEDRPKVIPDGSTNLALLGQFVEIPEDTVFTVEYSVRGAQMAVFELMGLDKKAKSIYKGEHHVDVLAKALRKFLT